VQEELVERYQQEAWEMGYDMSDAVHKYRDFEEEEKKALDILKQYKVPPWDFYSAILIPSAADRGDDKALARYLPVLRKRFQQTHQASDQKTLAFLYDALILRAHHRNDLDSAEKYVFSMKQEGLPVEGSTFAHLWAISKKMGLTEKANLYSKIAWGTDKP
jgi:hypothetical protein